METAVLKIEALSRDEIDLREYAMVLWRYRWFIGVVTVLAGAIAFWVASGEPKRYVATTKMMVASPTPESHHMEQYKALLNNRDLAQKVIQVFKLQDPPYRLNATNFLKYVLVVDDVGLSTGMVALHVRFPDPVLAAQIANKYQELAADLLARIGRDRNLTKTSVLKVQLDEARERRDLAVAALEQRKNSAQVELVRKDVGTMLDNRGRLGQLTVDLEGERARLAEALRQLAKQQPTTTAPSALDLGQAQQGVSQQPTRLRPETLSPYMNPVYQILQQQVTTSAATIAALERQRAELVSAMKPAGSQLTQMYAKESELLRLQADADLARAIFNGLASGYEQARATVTTPVMQVQLVEAAATPEEPESRGRLLKLEIGLVVGFVLSSVLVFLFHILFRSSRDNGSMARV